MWYVKIILHIRNHERFPFKGESGNIFRMFPLNQFESVFTNIGKFYLLIH